LSSVLIYFEEKIDGASYGIPWILVTLVVEKTKFLLFSSKNLFLTYILSQTPRKHLETFLDQSMTSKTQKKAPPQNSKLKINMKPKIFYNLDLFL
jgi:hypothetical protein